MATKTAQTETAPAAKTPTPKTLKPCTCSLFEFGQYGEDGSAESYEGSGTGCDRKTNRLFAQGHDAKLVGFLVRAELAGLEISTTEGGMRVTYSGAVKAAATVSAPLASKAEYMLTGAKERAEKKAIREAEQAKAKAAKRAEAEAAKAEKDAAANTTQPEEPTPAPEVSPRPAVTRKSPAAGSRTRRAKTTATA